VTSSTVVPYKASILFVSRNEENQIEIRPKVLDYQENLLQYTKSTFNRAVGIAAADGQPAKKHKVPGAGGGVKSPPVAKKVVQGGAGQDD
jgi:hypothetical protein